MSGAAPVLVDVEPGTLTLDPEQVRLALTPKTKAILPVHLYGFPADLEPLLGLARPRGIRVLEDCAQSHGARLGGIRTGAWGDLGAFSFYPTKNLGALGDGGAIATSDPELAQKARSLREYGWRERYVSHTPGFNSRLDEIQAAILRVQLRHLEGGNSLRRSLAAHYDDALKNTALTLPPPPGNREPVYHQYVVRHPDRNGLRDRLLSQGIGTLIHYPVPVHRQPAYQGRVRMVGDLRHSERAAETVLSLPLFPELLPEQAGRVAGAIFEWHRASAGQG
jgi:dTDP-4-amino-4,6-dideoxygalactose transaminase